MALKNLYLDINILQTVPSSNINRDDTGSPKTAIYGGVTRARVSSQSWKRATRLIFNKKLTKDDQYSLRTRYIPEMLADEYEKLNDKLDKDKALSQAVAVFEALDFTVDNKNQKKNGPKVNPTLKTALMVTPNEIHKFALATNEIRDDSSKLKKLKGLKKNSPQKCTIRESLKNDHPLDQALFGRMVAVDPSLNVDASVQVAHAISVNEITPEYDYFATVDESSSATGAAMLDTIYYNSSTLFRYANINIEELSHNLGSLDAAIKGIALFLKSFILSMPTGKENTFANKTLPQYVMLTLREDTPVNLVSAFEEPIKSNTGYVQTSIEKLEKEYSDSLKFIDNPIWTMALTNKKSQLEQSKSLNDLIEKSCQQIEGRLNDEDADN